MRLRLIFLLIVHVCWINIRVTAGPIETTKSVGNDAAGTNRTAKVASIDSDNISGPRRFLDIGDADFHIGFSVRTKICAEAYSC